MASYTITIEETGESFRCAETENLLVGMVRLGKKGIPVGCRGGGCGICKVAIVAGEVHTRVMSRSYISAEEEQAGIALACRVWPRSDVTLKVIGLMKKNVCRPDLLRLSSAV